MRKVFYIFALLLFITKFLYAGSEEQKLKAEKMMATYPLLFSSKDYNQTKHIFTIKGFGHNDKLLEELNQAFNSLMDEDDLPIVVTKDARMFISTKDERVKKLYPDWKYKYLENELFRNANPWKNLGVAGSADLLLTAALTGPKVGLDIVSGGASKIAKILGKGGKVGRSVVKIGSKFKVLKTIDYKKVQ